MGNKKCIGRPDDDWLTIWRESMDGMSEDLPRTLHAISSQVASFAHFLDHVPSLLLYHPHPVPSRVPGGWTRDVLVP